MVIVTDRDILMLDLSMELRIILRVKDIFRVRLSSRIRALYIVTPRDIFSVKFSSWVRTLDMFRARDMLRVSFMCITRRLA